MESINMNSLNLLPTIEPSASPINDNFVKIVELIQFILWCFTVPFYIFLLIFMIIAQRKKIDELATPFFKLCISTSIIDLLTLFVNYFGVIFPKRGYFLSIYLFLGTFYAHIYFYIAWSMGICQAMSVSVLATNRLSAMIFPNKYRSLWSGSKLLIAIGLQFIPGCSMGLLTFFNSAQLYVNSEQGIVPKFIDKKITNIYFLIGGVFLFANCFYLIIAYCYLFKILHDRNKKNIKQDALSKRRQDVRRREIRLFTMCSIIVGVQLVILLFFSLKMIPIFKLTIDEFYLFYNALSDLFASINPYLLWIFSDSLRKFILIQIGIRNKTTPTVTVSVRSKPSF